MKEQRTVLGFLLVYRWRLAGLLGLTAALSLLAMLPPLLTRAVIDRVLTRRETSLLPGLAAAMVLIPALHAACHLIQVLGVALVGQRFVMDVRNRFYAHLLRLSARFHSRNSVGTLVNRLMEDTATIQNMVTVSSVQSVSDLVCALFAVAVTFALNWRLATVLLSFVVLFAANYRLNIGGIRRVTRRHRGARDRLAGGLQNRLAADLTVKAFGAEMREHGIFQEQSDTTVDLTQESARAITGFWMNTHLLQSLGHAVIYFLGCVMVLRDSASYGDVIAFTTYAMQLLWPAVRFSQLAQEIQDAWISVGRIEEFLHETPEITNGPGAVQVERVNGNVDFDHVSFRYEKDAAVLDDLDLHVTAGQTVALVGPTGCGKSTIISLLLRFYDVVRGSVRIDGMDVRDMDLVSLRRQFGIVLQESLLFDTSIATNIGYSRPGADAAMIEQAARVAEIHDFIASLPNGYDTLMGGRGIRMSIGQKQRISIARSVLADPAIIIMDEATSALDSESERAIQAAMDRFLKGRTSFVVAHRLSTIRNADRIVLLARGRIVETGPHEELMRIPGGQYRDLYEKHAGKGVIDDL